MGTELVVATHRVQKFFDDLEAQKAILSTSTKLYATISDHFTALQKSLAEKFKSLDSKIESLESRSRQTLESLDVRETSLAEREASAAARVSEQKYAALAEFGRIFPANLDIAVTLKSLCRKMDSEGLLRFIVTKRKESVSLRAEIVPAMAEAVDAPRLVLDALEVFLETKAKKVGVTDKRWACGLLIQALFPEARSGSRPKGPAFARSVVERAAGVADRWKGQMDELSRSGGGTLGAAEAVMFVQMVIGFQLKEKYDEEFYKKLVMEHAARRDMAKLAGALQFGDIGDVIDELVKNGKEIEAIYFAFESGLTERFPPISLLKSYLKNSKKNASTIMKNGNNSVAASEESSTLELNSIRAVIKCVEDHKLESEFTLDSLRKRVTALERAKADRKKNSAAASSKSNNKRSYGSGGGGGGRGGVGSSSSRPAKAAKYSNAHPSSFNRRIPNPPPQHSPVTRYPGPYNYPSPTVNPPPQHSPVTRYPGPYNYPSPTVYDGATSVSYGTSYGVARAQSPVALPQQHIYSLSGDSSMAASSVFRSGGSYGGQTSYGGPYDYANATPPSYQPPPYQQ
ncbi:PREDICTED: FRIGIDA-like protein 4a isoform X1 [Fragaria vesca subsp. vesca]|uniref:FRIGIDA-like protein 4a isoform X1 n=1 Tax=Fragaria vesca subsp. vesca TaxID=101020 RepID=UPI0002C34E01|nr:PREDICTED: FRIGIDA-like protein 4a isoform X1 [Fragaria vesca subsp. vesca]